jgi:hypothetical protein
MKMADNKLLQTLRQGPVRKHGMAFFVIFVAVLGIWNAVRFGAASLDYYYVRNVIEKWQVSGAEQQSDYLSAKDAIIKTKKLHFSHPLYADLSGQITEWGVMAGYESLDDLSLAKTDYLRAVRMRPAWPVTWASLAMIKWRLNEFDDEMLAYVYQADSLGPQSPEVHGFFAELGLALYQANHPFYRNIREQTQARVVLGLRNPDSRAKVEAAIERYQAKNIACIWAQQRDSYVANHILDCKAS